MSDTLYRISWRDRFLIGALIVCLAPISAPMWLWSLVAFRWRLWRFLRGSPAEAWERCALLWSASQNACGGEIGPSMTTPFVHSLAEYFAHYHPDARVLLVEQLSNPDPYLAAYAFKCLIRSGPISPQDIPAEALERPEEIKAQRWGCIVDTLPLGQYMREYFQTGDYLKRGLTSRCTGGGNP